MAMDVNIEAGHHYSRPSFIFLKSIFKTTFFVNHASIRGNLVVVISSEVGYSF
jgi:hypothetical protein